MGIVLFGMSRWCCKIIYNEVIVIVLENCFLRGVNYYYS